VCLTYKLAVVGDIGFGHNDHDNVDDNDDAMLEKPRTQSLVGCHLLNKNYV